jgi:serine/threonine-protein kinase RsbW
MERALCLRIDAVAAEVPPVRRRVMRFAEEHGVDDGAMLGLALTEALSNAITHAYRDGEIGEIEITAEEHEDRLVVAVRDFGAGMAPRADSPGMGLGLPLIGTLARDLQIESGEDGTDVIMNFPKRRAVG